MPANPNLGKAHLERCADAFMECLNRGDLDDHIDEWTVFGGENPNGPLGFYGTFEDALTDAYANYVPGSFMVRKISLEYQKHDAPVLWMLGEPTPHRSVEFSRALRHKMFGRDGAPRIASRTFVRLTSGL